MDGKHNGRLTIIQGDITKITADAIVNAANCSLLGGGGVDGAIHRAAGPQLLEACSLLGGCPTGQARITPGFNLPAAFVIHTVGPVWQDGQHREDELLTACYRNSLQLAADHNLQTIAFPSISTGAYGFPVTRAARLAIAAIMQFLVEHDEPADVRIVCFDAQTYEAYRQSAVLQ